MFNPEEDIINSGGEEKLPNEESVTSVETEREEAEKAPAEASPKKAANKKTPRKVNVGQAVVTAILAALLAATIAVQATFVVLSDIYKQKVIEAYGKSLDFYDIAEVADIFKNNYLYEIDKEALNEDLIRAYVLLSGDRFARYYSAEEWAAEIAASSGNSFGIGAYVVSVPDGARIAHPMKGSPAESAGLLAGDFLVEIDGKNIAGYTLSEVTSLIAGESGTDVMLTIVRGEETLSIPVKRGTYEAETVLASVITTDKGKYGYIKITEFLSKELTAKHFKTAVEGLLENGCEGLIFDVRDNGGGQVDAVTDMLDFLLPEGPIMHITDLNGNETIPTIMSDASEIDCPMVVLTNQNTASAAELFTSALKDYNKATIVGTNTYGKGCGQNGYSLSNGGVLYVTSFLYNPPYSENYDKKGISPDVEVELPDEFKNTSLFFLSHEDDTQLGRALEEIKK